MAKRTLLLTLEVDVEDLPDDKREAEAKLMQIPVSEMPRLADVQPDHLALAIADTISCAPAEELIFEGSEMYVRLPECRVKTTRWRDEWPTCSRPAKWKRPSTTRTTPTRWRTTMQLPDGDYVLKDGAAWFTIKNFSVRVRATDEGVVCDIYPLNREADEAVASCYAYDSEIEENGGAEVAG